jgi:hypothetical protein
LSMRVVIDTHVDTCTCHLWRFEDIVNDNFASVDGAW